MGLMGFTNTSTSMIILTLTSVMTTLTIKAFQRLDFQRLRYFCLLEHRDVSGIAEGQDNSRNFHHVPLAAHFVGERKRQYAPFLERTVSFCS